MTDLLNGKPDVLPKGLLRTVRVSQSRMMTEIAVFDVYLDESGRS